jgi:AbrB family looped-hinge helix DNA binding protein
MLSDMATRLQTKPHDVRIGKRGAIVIPAEIRQQLGLEEGDVLALHVEEDGSFNLKAVPADPGERLRKAIRHGFEGVDPVAYQRSIRDEEDE